MARMRYIKPEFWTDPDLADVSPWARLLYIGTWNFALCDRGHLPDDARRLKMQVFPADDVNVTELVAELVAAGRLHRIEGPDGKRYLHVHRLWHHQKVDSRWVPRCAVCAGQKPEPHQEASPKLPETPESLGGLSETLPNSPQEGRGGEGRGGERETPSVSRADKPRTRRGHAIPDDWTPDTKALAWADEQGFPRDWTLRHTDRFRDFWLSKGEPRKDWTAAWRNWLSKEADQNARRGFPPPGQSRPSTTDDRVAGWLSLGHTTDSPPALEAS